MMPEPSEEEKRRDEKLSRKEMKNALIEKSAIYCLSISGYRKRKRKSSTLLHVRKQDSVRSVSDAQKSKNPRILRKCKKVGQFPIEIHSFGGLGAKALENRKEVSCHLLFSLHFLD